MKYRIEHITKYEYSHNASNSHNQAHLIPRDTDGQQCLSHKFAVTPTPDEVLMRHDVFGNEVAYFSLLSNHKMFSVSSISEVEVFETQKITDGEPKITVGAVQESLRLAGTEETRVVNEFLLSSPYVEIDHEAYSVFSGLFNTDRSAYEAVSELMGVIFTEFEYDPHFTDTATPLKTVLEHKKGVCQDFAHLAIACLRSHGLAARYVSGYLETIPPEGQEKLTGADASHAWFSVYIPGAGWMDFDPTNNIEPHGQHITLALGRDYSDVTPLKGVLFGGGLHTLSVSVDVSGFGLGSKD